MNLPQYLADSILAWLRHTAMPTTPTTLYFTLTTTVPTMGTAGTELASTGSYARVAVTAATAWNAIATVSGKRKMTNAADIVWPTATADWATDSAPVVGWECYDAATLGTGNRLAYGELPDAFPVLNGQTAKILAGDAYIAIG